MFNQMVTYNGLLNESSANHIMDNGQYITYSYTTPEEEVRGSEQELYYQEIDTDEEAPPPYSDTFNIN
ncbi:hypothetical protein H8356DRAFT_1702734 [Neocallimastix lanati (nom. inval.)]|nr:hypothetical protein H8356DRAFT_1702734 [Neocallimastix sp. JGI-2020a]